MYKIHILLNNFNKFSFVVFFSEKFAHITFYKMSFDMIFHLEDGEFREFFINAFDSTGMKCSDDALDLMVFFSQGSALMMQYIGDEVFWKTDCKIITKEIAEAGILNAADELAGKQLRLDLNRIGCKHYLNILLKVGKHQMYRFTESELEEILSDEENDVLNTFLAKMTQTDILIFDGAKNAYRYRFSNIIYYAYFVIKATLG